METRKMHNVSAEHAEHAECGTNTATVQPSECDLFDRDSVWSA